VRTEGQTDGQTDGNASKTVYPPVSLCSNIKTGLNHMRKLTAVIIAAVIETTIGWPNRSLSTTLSYLSELKQTTCIAGLVKRFSTYTGCISQ